MQKQITPKAPDYVQPVPQVTPEDDPTHAGELAQRRAARNGIEAFMRYMAPSGIKEVTQTPNRHHRLIIHQIEQMLFAMERRDAQAVQKFMLSCPPGSAKSTYVSVIAPVWMLARNPQIEILCVSCSDQLAEGFARVRRNLMDTPEFKRLAQTELDPLARSTKFQQTLKGGFVRAASVGSTITGFSCTVLLCDDLVSGFDVGQSQSQLQKLFQWYESEARSRKRGRYTLEFLIGTRWSVNDPIGVLLKRKEDGQERIDYVKLPLICSDPTEDPLGRKMGDILWEEQLGSPDAIADAKRSPLIFRCLYQQEPSDSSGLFCPPENLHAELTPPAELTYIAGIDIAINVGGGDWSVITIAGIDNKKVLHVVDVWREQVTPDKIADNLIRLCKQYKPKTVCIDNDNASKIWLTVLGQKCKEEKFFVPIDTLPIRNRNVEERASVFRAMLIQDLIIFKQADWTPTVYDEILSMPSGQHNDIVDTLALLCRRVSALTPPAVKTEDTMKHQMRLGPNGTFQINDSLDDLFKAHENGTPQRRFSRLRI